MKRRLCKHNSIQIIEFWRWNYSENWITYLKQRRQRRDVEQQISILCLHGSVHKLLVTRKFILCVLKSNKARSSSRFRSQSWWVCFNISSKIHIISDFSLCRLSEEAFAAIKKSWMNGERKNHNCPIILFNVLNKWLRYSSIRVSAGGRKMKIYILFTNESLHSGVSQEVEVLCGR